MSRITINLKRPIPAGAVLAAAIGLAGCAHSSRSTAPTTLPVPASTGASHADVTLSPPEPYPHRSLQVTAIGLAPRQRVQIVECSIHATSVSRSGCDLTATEAATAGVSGKVVATFRPSEGPFGARDVSCQRPHSCRIGVAPPGTDVPLLGGAPVTFRP